MNAKSAHRIAEVEMSKAATDIVSRLEGFTVSEAASAIELATYYLNFTSVVQPWSSDDHDDKCQAITKSIRANQSVPIQFRAS